MSNRYSGYCADCRRDVDPGHGDLRKESGRWVVRCGGKSGEPAVAVGVKTYQIHGGSGYGCRGWTVSHVVHNSAQRITAGEPAYLHVLRASRRYVSDDGLSFGVGDEAGYLYSAVCREATAEEAAPLIQRERRTAEVKVAKERLAELAKRVRATGERPSADESQVVDGERLFDSQDIYGGGNWWIIQPEAAVWYIQNNGADGDNWAHNNVRTGGAGAIGWRVPFSEDLVAALHGLRDILAGTIEEEARTAQILAMATDAIGIGAA